MSDVRIVGFEPRFAADFARLNYDWIEKYFAVETHDREILDNPATWVIKPGGQIFMALVDGQAAGTVALIPDGEVRLELTKMAVSPRYQGRGLGDRLMLACIDHARANSVSCIWLESHTKLTPALKLYGKFGFVATPRDPNSLYSRADIRMERVFDVENPVADM
ncbi:MAG: GNAT family N-acetyltransferase [Acidobacteria bacterium]|nr:GNAT family N-acetyltransferase [Acidobacteriota bacterium]